MKTAELTGAALDWAVWTAGGGAAAFPKTASGAAFRKLWIRGSAKYIHPSTDWAQGGPIIEREEIGICRNAPCTAGRQWEATPSITAKGAGGKWGYGPTPLIAAMRCYVASKLGDEVDVPKELMQ